MHPAEQDRDPPPRPGAELTALRRQLAQTRLRLFEADARLDQMQAADAMAPGRALLRLQARHPRLTNLLIRTTKLIVWTGTAQLRRYIRAARRAKRSVPPIPPIISLAESATHPIPPHSAPGGGTVLIVDQTVLKPDQDAGSRCTMSTVVAFREAGWAVYLWPNDRSFGGRYTADLEALGVCVLDARQQGGLADWLRQFGPGLDHVVLSRPRIAEDVLPDVLRWVTCRISFMGHDLHFVRQGLKATQLDDPLLQHEADRFLALERSIWRVVDMVLYLSEDEVAVVRELEPGVEALVLTPYAFDAFQARPAPPPDHNLLFIGGFAHSPNEDAVIWFVTEILPIVRNVVPNARLKVVGSAASPSIRALPLDDVDLVGQISDEELATAYNTARVVVAPLRFGAGVKGKVVEALAKGVPLVTSTVGAQGIPGLAAFVPVHDDPRAIAAAIVTLLNDDRTWIAQSSAQAAYAQCHYSRQALRQSLFAAVTPPKV